MSRRLVYYILLIIGAIFMIIGGISSNKNAEKEQLEPVEEPYSYKIYMKSYNDFENKSQSSNDDINDSDTPAHFY